MSCQVIGNQIWISQDDPMYSNLRMNLSRVNDDGLVEKAYLEYNNEYGSNYMVIGYGLINWIPQLSDLAKSRLQIDPQIDPNVLPGYILRPEQIMAIRLALKNQRGLIQSATGSGKSLMICGVLKYLSEYYGYYPNSIVLVPTKYLQNEMLSLMESLHIEAKSYSAIREDFLNYKGVIVAHPKSINNDIKSNKIDLSKIQVLIADEAHHLGADTWSNLVMDSINAEFILGFSASIIRSDRLPVTKLSDLSIDELKILGTAGPILLDIPTSYYAGKGILATPKVIVINHRIVERIRDDRNWIQIRKYRLESDSRTKKIAQVASIFNSFNLKVLILINTHEHGFRLLDMLDDLGLSQKTACSYGSYKFYQKIDGEVVTLPTDSMDKFKSGELQILIGSSHIFEGVDIPSLDVVIMGVVGKSSRRIIQGVGRSLRKTKNGRYAYIVDFTDENGGILSYHTYQRKFIYKNEIGVASTDIFDKISLDKLPILINNLETIEEE